MTSSRTAPKDDRNQMPSSHPLPTSVKAASIECTIPANSSRPAPAHENERLVWCCTLKVVWKLMKIEFQLRPLDDHIELPASHCQNLPSKLTAYGGRRPGSSSAIRHPLTLSSLPSSRRTVHSTVLYICRLRRGPRGFRLWRGPFQGPAAAPIWTHI